MYGLDEIKNLNLRSVSWFGGVTTSPFSNVPHGRRSILIFDGWYILKLKLTVVGIEALNLLSSSV